MRDVIGQDELEDAAPARASRTGARSRPWAGGLAAVLVVVLVVVLVALLVAQGDGPPAGSTEPASRSAVGDAAEADRRGAAADGAAADSAAADGAALAARPLGGDTVRTPAGAAGLVRLEVRNGGAALRLRSLTAEVPGVRFTQLVRPHGVELGPDERIELVLGFAIDDCAQLRRTGRLVLAVEQDGVPQEVGLRVTHDWEAGTVRQVALDRVLEACPR